MNVGTTATFKKGMMVKVKPETDFSGEIKTRWAEVNGKFTNTGEVLCHWIWRDRTEAEHREWNDSDESKGMDSAGETKLDSPSRWRVPAADEVFIIVKARVTAPCGWNTVPGCAEIEDTQGVRWFVKRGHLH
jgi:hypothetical protein